MSRRGVGGDREEAGMWQRISRFRLYLLPTSLLTASHSASLSLCFLPFSISQDYEMPTYCQRFSSLTSVTRSGRQGRVGTKVFLRQIIRA